MTRQTWAGLGLTMAALLLALVLFLGGPAGVAATAVTLTPQSIGVTPITPTYTTILTDGIVFGNSGAQILDFKNGTANTVYITVETTFEIMGFAIPDLYFTIPAGGQKMIGQLPPAVFNNTSGQVQVRADVYSGVTMALYRVK